MKNILSTREKSKFLLKLFNYKKEELIQRGIYSISFNNSQRIYIGSATQIHDKWNECGFYIRWRYHLYELIKGTHYSSKLQNSFDKHGIQNIRFTIIKSMNTHSNEEILLEEDNIIERGNYIKFGLNSSRKKSFEEYIKSDRVKTKEVFVFTEGGSFFKKFKSRKLCGEFFGITMKTVCFKIKGNYKFNGYLFFNDANFFIRKRKGRNTKPKDIIVFDSKEDKIHTFNYVKDIIKYFNIADGRNIYLCLDEKIPSTNNLIILYKNRVNLIKVPTKSTFCIYNKNEIKKIYSSLREMSIELGYSETSISNYLLGKGKKNHVKHDIRKIILPIKIYQQFLNTIKNYDC